MKIQFEDEVAFTSVSANKGGRQGYIKEEFIAGVYQTVRNSYGVKTEEPTIECCILILKTGGQLVVEESLEVIQERRKIARDASSN